MASTNDVALAKWPRAWAQALDDAALEGASSATVFKRGRSYADSGCVEVIAEDPLPEPAVRAIVAGTEVYATAVWIEEDALAGDCDCPHARDGWFCKHQVAVALVWRERLAHAPGRRADAPGTASAAARPRTVKDQRRALQDFLRGLEPSVLVDRLLDLADRDRDLWRELQQWRKLAEIKGGLVDLEPMIDEMLSPGRDFIAWDETASYVRRADAVLPLLRDARERHPAEAIPLCIHALRRAWRALESADDSNGQIGGLCEAIGAELTWAVRVAGSQPASFGDAYLQWRLEDPFDCFDAAAVEAAMGEAALARYRQVLAECAGEDASSLREVLFDFLQRDRNRRRSCDRHRRRSVGTGTGTDRRCRTSPCAPRSSAPRHAGSKPASWYGRQRIAGIPCCTGSRSTFPSTGTTMQSNCCCASSRT